ncbi:hypothetical protein ABDF71_25255 [Ochrobactrum sp. WV_118_8]
MRNIIRKISDFAFVASSVYLIGFFTITVALPLITYSDAFSKLVHQIFSVEGLRMVGLIWLITLATKLASMFSSRRFITNIINQAVRDELARIEREKDTAS